MYIHKPTVIDSRDGSGHTRIALAFSKEYMGVARIFQRGGHTDSYRGYSSDCHLNIVSCLLTRRLTKGGGGVTGTPGPPLATPME